MVDLPDPLALPQQHAINAQAAAVAQRSADVRVPYRVDTLHPHDAYLQTDAKLGLFALSRRTFAAFDRLQHDDALRIIASVLLDNQRDGRAAYQRVLALAAAMRARCALPHLVCVTLGADNRNGSGGRL